MQTVLSTCRFEWLFALIFHDDERLGGLVGPFMDRDHLRFSQGKDVCGRVFVQVGFHRIRQLCLQLLQAVIFPHKTATDAKKSIDGQVQRHGRLK